MHSALSLHHSLINNQEHGEDVCDENTTIMLTQTFIHKSYQPGIQLHSYLLDFFRTQSIHCGIKGLRREGKKDMASTISVWCSPILPNLALPVRLGLLRALCMHSSAQIGCIWLECRRSPILPPLEATFLCLNLFLLRKPLMSTLPTVSISKKLYCHIIRNYMQQLVFV